MFKLDTYVVSASPTTKLEQPSIIELLALDAKVFPEPPRIAELEASLILVEPETIELILVTELPEPNANESLPLTEL